MSTTTTTPSNVRRASERADDMIRQLQQASAPGAQPASEPGSGGEAEGSADGEVSRPSDQPTSPAQPSADSPQRAESQEPVPSAPPTPAPEGDEDTATLRKRLAELEQEARTWRGRHAADTARYKQQLDDMMAQYREMLDSRAGQDTGHSDAPAPPAGLAVTQDEVDNFGSDLVDFVQKVAASAAQRAVRAVEDKIAALKNVTTAEIEGVRTMSIESRREDFFNALERAVPSWRELNHDQSFIDWLNGFYPGFVEPRKKAFDDALKTLQSAPVIEMIREFQRQRGTTGPQSSDGTARNSVSAPAAGQAPGSPVSAQTAPPTLAEFAAPGRARGAGAASPPQDSGKKVWRLSDITAAYRALSRGDYKGRSDEWAAMEREFTAAQREGRVNMAE